MDLSTLTGQGEKVMIVVKTIKDDPNFLNEFKANPQEALNKIGVELSEEEIGYVQKLEQLSEFKDEFIGIIGKIKLFFGFKDTGH